MFHHAKFLYKFPLFFLTQCNLKQKIQGKSQSTQRHHGKHDQKMKQKIIIQADISASFLYLNKKKERIVSEPVTVAALYMHWIRYISSFGNMCDHDLSPSYGTPSLIV